jgi:hypothetical protein
MPIEPFEWWPPAEFDLDGQLTRIRDEVVSALSGEGATRRAR